MIAGRKKGFKHSNETKNNLKKAWIKRKSKGLGVAWNKGKKTKKETCEKISKAHKGKIIPNNVRIKMGSKLGKNGMWRGGKTNNKGYILLKSENHLYSNNNGYVKEHRLIVEKLLKRYLTKKEVIHHINGIKNDNTIENLYIFRNLSEHSKYHLLLKNNNIKLIKKSNLKNYDKRNHPKPKN